MKKRILFILMATHLVSNGSAQAIRVFENNVDVGPVKHKGATLYDSASQSYTVSGSGNNMWFGQDEFQYAYKSIQGDFILRARVEFLGDGVDPHRKVGWTVRNNLHPESPHVNATVHGDGLTSLQFRREKGSSYRRENIF